jgi:hypothetical protein
MSEQGGFQVGGMSDQNFHIDSSAVRGFFGHQVGVADLNTLRNSIFRIRKHESVYIEGAHLAMPRLSLTLGNGLVAQ